jgi:hypothetical protein
MKKIISYLLFKGLQISLPFFFIMMAVAIVMTPFALAMTFEKLYWLLGWFIAIPVAIVIVSFTNNFTDWNNLWEFGIIKCMIKEYKNEKRLRAKDKLERKLDIPSIYDNEPGETMYDEGGHADYHHSLPNRYK